MIEQDEPTIPKPPTTTEQAKTEARNLGNAVRERAINTTEKQRQYFTGEIGDIARRLEELGDGQGGDLAHKAAGWVRRLEQTLGEHSTEELLDLAGQRVKERPGLFLAGCFAAGFGVARLLRK
jgi:hypothetical protein